MLMKISLCTYTFNDADLAGRLLASVGQWTIRPDEILVVDDGSAVPFEPPAGVAARVIRHETNRGFLAAKRQGLASCASPVIVSVDCDMYLSPNWLELVLPHAVSPGVGIAGGSLVARTGKDLVSRYLRVFDHYERVTGARDFIPGNVWMLRREVWDRVGGFGDHADSVGEDVALCAAVRRLGLTLFTESRAVARQTRKLGRIALVRRFWRWRRPALLSLLERGDTPVLPFLSTMAVRIDHALALGEYAFAYLEILHFSYAMLDAARIAERLGHPRAADACREAFAQGWLALAGYPETQALLLGDLREVGFLPRDTTVSDTGAVGGLIGRLRGAGALDRLEGNLEASVVTPEKDLSFSAYVA